MSRSVGVLLAASTLASLASLGVTLVERSEHDERMSSLEAAVVELRAARGHDAVAASRDGSRGAVLSTLDLEAITEACALAAAPPSPATPPRPALAEEEDESTDPEVVAASEQARAEAESRIDAAVERGRWEEHDAFALQRLLGRLTREDGEAVGQRLASLINDGAIELHAEMPF